MIQGAVAVIAVIGLSGCATIFSGSSQQVSFHSNPDGATVKVGENIIGKTPMTTSLKRKSGQVITFEKEGYNAVNTDMATKLNPVFFGNILIGGLIGTSTDISSGAIMEYAPSQYMVTLNPMGTSQLDGPVSRSLAQRTTEFIVVGYDDILRDLHQGGGPYAASLLTLLGVSREEREGTIDVLLALSEKHVGAPEFASQVVQSYGLQRLAKVDHTD
jgi:hypothetical protein